MTAPTDAKPTGVKAPGAKVPGDKPTGAKAPGAKVPGDKPAGDPWEIVQADFTAAAGPGSTLPDHGLEVAFAGRSNVGKSSLINALTGRKSLARTGSTPGVTRALVQFSARTRGGADFALVDLPGYGFAQRSKAERRDWANLIEGYLREREQLVAVVLLVDARRGLEEDDLELCDFVARSRPAERAVQLILVATKIDKVNRSLQQKALVSLHAAAGAAHASARVIAWSSVTGQGKSELGRRIALALEREPPRR